MIKILSPIDRAKETLLLIKAGADEFFCGVIIGQENLGSIRGPGDARKYNFPNITELKKAVSIIKRNGKKIFITLNYPFINPKMKETIHRNMEILKSLEPDGFIVSDLGLISELKDCGVELIASSIIETKNKEVVRLLKKINIKRVIFDRQITLDDIRSIVSEFPGIKFETFVMSSACRNLAGYCHHQLLIERDKGHTHFCWTDFSVRNSKSGESLSLYDRKIVGARLKMPRICCGVCALFQFKKNNISSVKIVGRGFTSVQKINNVKFVRNSLNILEKGYSKDDFYQKMRELFRKRYGFRCNKEFCYYPHFFDE